MIRKLRHIVLGLTLTLTPLAASSQSTIEALLSGGAKIYQALTLSDAQVAQYVHSYIEGLDAESQVLPPSNPYSKRLARLTKGLTQVDGIPLNFKVYKTDQVNAFACADGSVRVYTGLMDLMTDDEVLGVLGHEMGHVALHHSKKQFKSALMNSALRDGLSSASGIVGKLSRSQLGDLAESLAGSSFSRKQETQADEYGYKYLRAAGKNPWAMVLAFKKLLALENGANASRLQKLFSSHPDTAKRIKNMAKKCQKDHIAPPAGADVSLPK